MQDATAAMTRTGASREGSGRDRLLGIEALRGLAALSVATLHALGASAMRRPGGGGTCLPLEAGVDVFFVISGFVMGHSMWDQFGAPGATRRFLVARATRIVPLYWFVTTAFVLLAVVRPRMFTDALGGGPNLVASYLLVPWPRDDGLVLPVFRLGWTLEYEAMFYATLAFWIRFRRPWGIAGVVGSLLGVLLVGQACRSAPAVLAYWSNPIALEFVLGVVIAVGYRRGLDPRAMVGSLALALAIAWAVCGRAAPPPRAIEYGLPAAAAVVVALAASGAWRTPASVRRAVLWFGAVSYSLYLTHLFAVRSTREVFTSSAMPWPMVVLVAMAASVVLAGCAHRFETMAASALRGRLPSRAVGVERPWAPAKSC